MTGRKTGVQISRLAVPYLLGAVLAGCRPAPPVPAIPQAAPPPRAGSIDVRRYLALHPAAAQLRALERDLRRLRYEDPEVTLLPLDAPEPADLPAPTPLDPTTGPSLQPDLDRARKAVRDDFTFRRLAQPDRMEERYQAELGRLRRRYLEARVEIPQTETEPQLADAARRAAEMDRLERRIRELDDPPARRALLSLEELRERRAEREKAQQALEELQREEIRRLREALTVPRRRPLAEPEIPAAELARVERERNEAKVAADLQLIQEEQEALARLETQTLPAPAAQEPDPLPVPPDPPRLAPAATAPPRLASPGLLAAPKVRAALASLLAEYRQLRDAIYRDLTVAGREAARREGIELHPRSAGVRDRTTELLPAVRRLLAGLPRHTNQRTNALGKEGRK